MKKRRSPIQTAKAAGFTLVEAVIAIVVAAILAVGIIDYIGNSVEGYTSAASRNQLASSGRTVIDRLALELENAVPNSIRVTPTTATGDQCLEFLPFEAVTTSIDAPTTGQGSQTFDIVQSRPGFDSSSAGGYYAVVYPNNTGDLYDVGGATDRGSVAVIDSFGGVSGGVQTITLTEQHRFPRRSPVERMFITRQPVTFCVVDNRIYRYSEYGFQATQCASPDVAALGVDWNDCLPGSPATGRHLITDNVDNSVDGGLTAFTYSPSALRRNAIVALDLNFTARGDTVRLTHDVLARNVP
ncbi:MAG: prepilin-type N-terminal cleavage/methylation domain-containing protein [Pseudohongiellaceae bacterium]